MNLNNSIPLFVDLDGTIIKEDIGRLLLKKRIKIISLIFLGF